MLKNLKFKDEEGFTICDYDNPAHRKALCELLNKYMSDPMGNYPQHDEHENALLVEGMKNHPTSITLFLFIENKPVGLVNAFMNFSTFRLKPYINLHDVFILPEYRGRGLGQRMIAKMKEIAIDNGCCKISLEVRHDNPAAQHCYRSEGFGEDVPPMYYWEAIL